MVLRSLKILVLGMCAALLIAAPALAATTGATGAKNPDATVKANAVEPTAGKPAPAPVDTTPVTPTPPATTTAAPAAQPTSAAVGASGATGPQGVRRKTDGGLSGTALAIIAAAALLALLTGLAAFARWRGWTSRRADRWRHAAGEANWRLSLRAAEFRDFLKLGR